MLQRRVGRQQIVVGIDYADVEAFFSHHFKFVQTRNTGLVVIGHGGKGVRHIGATHALCTGFALGCHVDVGQVGAAGGRAAFDDSAGDCINNGVESGDVGHRSQQTKSL